jgi:hypothetical protein
MGLSASTDTVARPFENNRCKPVASVQIKGDEHYSESTDVIDGNPRV